MTDEKRRAKALEGFLKNDYWRGYYENAPSKLCKEYVKVGFSYSKTIPGEDEEKRDLRQLREIEPKLTLKDWEHIFRHTGGGYGRFSIKKRMEQYLGKQAVEESVVGAYFSKKREEKT